MAGVVIVDVDECWNATRQSPPTCVVNTYEPETTGWLACRQGELTVQERNMQRRSRKTFKQVLIAVAPRNAQSLEHKANTAVSLAVTYPTNAGAFLAIEAEAVRQMFHALFYMVGMPSTWTVVDERPSPEPAAARLAAD
jgi:hypothetical protein